MMALADATPAVIPAEPVSLEARLRTCSPKTEKQALDCLDRILTPDERRRVLAAKFWGGGTFQDFRWLTQPMWDAWWLSYDFSPLYEEYARHGFGHAQVDRSVPNNEELLVQSYWLRGHGCRNDWGLRLKEYRSLQEALSVGRDELGIWAYRYQPRCRDGAEATP